MTVTLQLVREAKQWIKQTNGVFTEHQFAKAMALAFDAHTCGQLLQDLILDGTIRAHGKKHGFFEKTPSGCEDINWHDAQVEEYPIWMPLGLSRRIVISPGNIIVIAGEKNAGKTSFAKRIAYENLSSIGGAHDEIHYFDYEAHPAEVKNMHMSIDTRLNVWDGLRMKRASSNFHEYIDPDGFNIIDYMKVSNDFFLVGENIGKIHNALNDGIAIICIQKKKGEKFGRGGEFTLEEARLGLSLFSEGPLKWCHITKCKFPREYPNPEGMEIDYSLTPGAHFTEKTEWRYMSDKERKKYNEDALFEEKAAMYRNNNACDEQGF